MSKLTKTIEDQFHQLSFYTLAHPDKKYFIHQHAVDAYQAQMADEKTKPITIIFSLLGLYLYLEKNYTGRQVQLAHMRLSRRKRKWPQIKLPEQYGIVTVSEVMKKPEGTDRDSMINEWCQSVWSAYNNSHKIIATIAETA